LLKLLNVEEALLLPLLLLKLLDATP